ncbi:MAG TPA: hypothetical protein VHL14_03425, partial [Steroidobacteraceae bacterium]|nr:hypothetical protein [Steroidobacteraceae bacterium]
MSFITRLLRFFWMLLDGIRKVLHLVLLLVLFAVVIAAFSSGKAPVLPGTAALLIAPQGELVEQLSEGPLDQAVAEAMGQRSAETRVRDVVDAIHHA